MASVPPVDYSRLKVLSILEGPGAAVLTFILKRGTNAPTPPLPLHSYLNSLSQSCSTANYCRLNSGGKRKAFTNTEKKTLGGDLSWVTFDISLLYKAIRLACENVAELNDKVTWEDPGSMEGLIREIKEERNTFVHERMQMTQSEFLVKVRDLKKLFMDTLQAAQVKYSIPDLEFLQEKHNLEKSIHDILECFTMEEILRLDCVKMLSVLKNMLVSRLSNIYETTQIFDPLCFLSGSSDTSIHIQTIFAKILMKEKRKKLEIHYFDLLKFTQRLGQPANQPQFHQPTQPPQSPDPTQPPQSLQPQLAQSVRPQLILIDGVAGSGKTTLLTFILSEWLKDERDRRIRNLQEYDFVLRVLCRERNGVSLQEYLEHVLPEAVAFRPNTMTLLSRCKILFLIDGLDERNSSSHQLVEDILRQCEHVPGFTIVCTSRPETVIDFLQSVSGKYGKSQVVMEGISCNDRTEFVLKYYNCLGVNGSSNVVRLRQVMESIGWRDHFGLPLNLLFLATLFHDDPDSVRRNTTQTGLYLAIHHWSVEKLQSRLAQCSQLENFHRLSREEGIKKVLEMIYEIALSGLLEDRLNLSDTDMDRLRECCRVENLPREEVLGAFFALRQSVVRRVVHQTYYAPHKGLLEFFASKHIVKQLVESSPARSIRRLLRNPSRATLRGLTNLLLHVAGLLSHPDVPARPAAIREVVDLLAETRVLNCDDWLSLLEDTEVNLIALDRIAELITSRARDHETVSIMDNTVTSAAALLPLIPRKMVEIEIRREEADVNDLCRAVANHNCTKLLLRQHYQHPGQTPASVSVLRALRVSPLVVFMGHLSAEGVMLLQNQLCLWDLQLAVSTDKDTREVLSALTVILPSLPHLSFLRFHVPVAAVTPKLLTMPLPDVTGNYGGHGVSLVLSGVEEGLLDKTCQIAAAIQPRAKGYGAIKFPGSMMEAAAWWRLLNQLGDADVRVGWSVEVPETNPITEEEARELWSLTRTKLLGDFMRLPEESLW